MSLPHPRRLLAGLCVAVATWSVAQPAHAAPTPPTVPVDIAVPDGHKPFLLGHAVGVQTYTCTSSAAGFAWGPATPLAGLYDDRGNVVVRHFGGPTWQANDGSAVVGRRDRDVTVDATAIPWLRLSAASRTAGPDGDRLAATTYIQRIATTGGLPPAPERCGAATAGTAVAVPYTADYVFWKATAA